MARRAAPLMVSLNNPLKTFSLGDPGHIDPLSDFKGFHLQLLAELKGSGIKDPEFLERSKRFELFLLKVAAQRAVDAPKLHFVKPDLQGLVTFGIRLFDLSHRTRTYLKNGDSQAFTVFGKNLRHPDLTADQARF
jgi:hypothetical protein